MIVKFSFQEKYTEYHFLIIHIQQEYFHKTITQTEETGTIARQGIQTKTGRGLSPRPVAVNNKQ